MYEALEIFPCVAGGYIVVNQFSRGGPQPPDFLFAGTLPECLEFMRGHFQSRETVKAGA